MFNSPRDAVSDPLWLLLAVLPREEPAGPQVGDKPRETLPEPQETSPGWDRAGH